VGREYDETAGMEPRDEHNRILTGLVRPADWRNPRPAPRYNLVVIGAGTAGLVAAAGAAGLGAKVALVERAYMGGDCLNFGCVPSKALIAAARAAAAVRDAGRFGVRVKGEVGVDFAAVMERMRRLRASIAPNDSADRFRRLGVDVFFGQAAFLDASTVEVGGERLAFSKALIATGARAAVPSVPGLDEVPYLTNETVFSLTELPARLAVIGSGPIGCELAQAFARLGSEVLLVQSSRGVLPREERDAAEIVLASMRRDGVRTLCCGRELRLSGAGRGIGLSVDGGGNGWSEVADALLVATGRVPNTEGLGLDAAGIECDARGVRVDNRLRTTNPAVYAAGDVCSEFRFTHAADFMARTVLRNALFGGRARVDRLVIPRCTYTDPELAQVGLTAREAEEKGIAVTTVDRELRDVDRAVLDGRTDGLVRVLLRKGTDRIVGATVVAANAGDIVSEITLAMTAGLGLGAVAGTIHPYPTQAEAVRQAGDAFNRTRLTPPVRWLFSKWMAWGRR